MPWILLVIIAYFCSAGIFIVDRYLLKKGFPNPLSYAFYVGILSIFVLLLVPFGFYIPSIGQIIIGLSAGIIWLLATIIFYIALYKGESSRVVPVVGALTPLFILVLSFIFLEERLKPEEFIAFFLLVSGGLVLSLLTERKPFLLGKKKIYLMKDFILVLASALIYAIYFVMTKYVFINQTFVNGLIWTRLGTALAALFLLISPIFRKMIFKKEEIVKAKTFGIFFSARILGVIAGLFIYLAIYFGSVTLVNALQGVQYFFLLLLAFLLFRKIPSLKEQFDKKVLMQKIFAIFIICIGLVILVI